MTCFFVFFFCKNSFISWLFPFLFGMVPQSYLRSCFLGYSPQKVPQIKLNLNFQAVFFEEKIRLSFH